MQNITLLIRFTHKHTHTHTHTQLPCNVSHVEE